jgi:hypothetical protein
VPVYPGHSPRHLGRKRETPLGKGSAIIPVNLKKPGIGKKETQTRILVGERTI